MKYDIIYVDFPWQYRDKAHAGKRGVEYKYNTMTDSEIKQLPIPQIMSDNCAVFMWATSARLPAALEVIKAYGLEFKNIAFTWIKTNKKNKNTLFWGMGSYTRQNTEVCLLATKGKPKRVNASVHQIIMSPIEQHSKKPDEVRERIIKLMGDKERIEIFARDNYDGWTCIGNEIDGKDINIAINQLINS